MSGPAAVALDRRLHELRSLRDTVVAGVLQLEADATFEILAASGRLSGATAVRVQPVLARLTALRSGVAQVDQLLDQVSAVRDSHQLTYEQAVELVALLNSPAVTVSAGSRAATQQVTPQELLEAVGAAVDGVRAVVVEVEAAWRELLPRLERAQRQADQLVTEMPGFPALDEARTMLAALPDRIASDPVGAVDELAGAEAALAAAGSARGDLTRLRDELAAAAALLAELDAAVREGHAALQRSRDEVAAPQGLLDPVGVEVLDGERGLRPWLARLERLVAEGDLVRASRGVESWRHLADQTLDAARQVAEANAGPYRRRHELQGLLRAAQVKAGAAGRAEDPALTQLLAEARQALAAPCDLPAAERAVNAYLDELRQTPTPAQRDAAPSPEATDAPPAPPASPASLRNPLRRGRLSA